MAAITHQIIQSLPGVTQAHCCDHLHNVCATVVNYVTSLPSVNIQTLFQTISQATLHRLGIKHSPREASTITKMLSGLFISRFSMGMRSHRVLLELGHEPRWQACSEIYTVHPSLFTESSFYWIPCTRSRCRETPHLCREHRSSSTGRRPDITFVHHKGHYQKLQVTW